MRVCVCVSALAPLVCHQPLQARILLVRERVSLCTCGRLWTCVCGWRSGCGSGWRGRKRVSQCVYPDSEAQLQANQGQRPLNRCRQRKPFPFFLPKFKVRECDERKKKRRRRKRDCRLNKGDHHKGSSSRRVGQFERNERKMRAKRCSIRASRPA